MSQKTNPRKQRTIQKYFDYFLKDFEVDHSPEQVRVPSRPGVYSIKEHRIELPPDLKIWEPALVFITFVHLKKFEFTGKDEKTAWTIPVKYKGEPFLLTHRKFGFRIISNKNNEEVTVLAVEAISNIKKAFPYAQELYEPVIRALTNEGQITLVNQYGIIYDRYNYFREAALREYDEANAIRSRGIEHVQNKSQIPGGFIANHNLAQKHYRAGANNATGMLDSYFCLLEHLLVLLLPFTRGLDVQAIGLERFIGLNWKEKLMTILPLSLHADFQKLFERLLSIKEMLRNPLTHGYFLKEGASFYVQIPYLYAVPMKLVKKSSQFHYGFLSAFHEPTFKEICHCFDDLDSYLSTTDKTKYGYTFIRRGIDVYFDQDSIREYRSSMKSMKQFESLMDRISRQQDDANNMDW